MSLNNKQISNILHTLNRISVRMIDAIDNHNELTVLEKRDLLNELCLANCDMNADEILSTTAEHRRLLIKRGGTDKNNLYVGAAGEITMDTEANTIRVHDGKTAGGITLARVTDIPEIPTIPTIPSDINNADYVTAHQTPTSGNKYTWYRKYKSGWVEQGGITTAQTVGSGTSEAQTITFPVKMKDTNYVITFGALSGTYSNAILSTRTQTGGTLTQSNRAGSGNTTVQHTWFVAGIAA